MTRISLALKGEDDRVTRIITPTDEEIMQLLLAVRADLTNDDHRNFDPAAKVLELAEKMALVTEEELSF